ncbi:olfactory receptor 6N1-like [Xenopus laevis]|nr:olfactory receptor 6N1-like [Xenopus laevis]
MTTVEEFILLAFSDLYQLQILLFIVILLVYIMCVFGNFLIIFIIRAEPSLQTPMYFLISTLSTLEIIYVSSVVPNLLANLIAVKKTIFFNGCFIQLFVGSSLGTSESYLLAVMAFDRVLAINKPLQYVSIMTQRVCVQLALLPFIVGIVIALIPTVLTAILEFCGPNEIHHFICDFARLQSLACSNTYMSTLVTNSGAIFAFGLPFTITLGLYIHIIIIISKISSAESKWKAFSTCSSHLTAAGLFYITTIMVYTVPKGSQYDRFFALIYTILTPLLNPFIYTFRNKDIKRALIKSRRLKLRQLSF